MRKILHITASIVLFFTSELIIAQTDIQPSDDDSINSIILQDYQKIIAVNDDERLADSVKKQKLENKMNGLNPDDKIKKEKITTQLKDIDEREKKRIAEKRKIIDSLRVYAKAFPVKGFFNDTLFLIFTKTGSFTAQERAEAISGRIKKIADNHRFKTDSLKLVQADNSVDIVFGETIIMNVSENDAIWNVSTPLELAKRYKHIIGESVLNYQTETGFATLAKEVLMAFLVLGLMLMLLFYARKFFGWTGSKIKLYEGRRIKGIKISNYTLLDSKREVNVLLTVNSALKWFFILLIIYIALPILFGIFPWTKNFASILFGYILNPVKKIAIGFWNYLPNLITIIVLVIVFRYLLKAIYYLKNEIEKGNLVIPGFYADWANPTYQIVRVIIYAFMLVVIFPYLPGSDSPIFKGVSVFLGFLFTFGSAGSLSNIMSGLVLTYMRLFKIGDYVKIGEVVGVVIEKSILVTRIRTIKNEIVSIPNSTVMSNHTLNYTSDTNEKGLILHTKVSIGYSVPWKDLHQALINAAQRTELVLKEPKPYVFQTSLDDFYVTYQINAYTKEAARQDAIYSQLHQNIQDCCSEVGIEILSPHYRSERDGNMTSIPASYLNGNYKVPGFNVNLKTEASSLK